VFTAQAAEPWVWNGEDAQTPAVQLSRWEAPVEVTDWRQAARAHRAGDFTKISGDLMRVPTQRSLWLRLELGPTASDNLRLNLMLQSVVRASMTSTSPTGRPLLTQRRGDDSGSTLALNFPMVSFVLPTSAQEPTLHWLRIEDGNQHNFRLELSTYYAWQLELLRKLTWLMLPMGALLIFGVYYLLLGQSLTLMEALFGVFLLLSVGGLLGCGGVLHAWLPTTLATVLTALLVLLVLWMSTWVLFVFLKTQAAFAAPPWLIGLILLIDLTLAGITVAATQDWFLWTFGLATRGFLVNGIFLMWAGLSRKDAAVVTMSVGQGVMAISCVLIVLHLAGFWSDFLTHWALESVPPAFLLAQVFVTFYLSLLRRERLLSAEMTYAQLEQEQGLYRQQRLGLLERMDQSLLQVLREVQAEIKGWGKQQAFSARERRLWWQNVQILDELTQRIEQLLGVTKQHEIPEPERVIFEVTQLLNETIDAVWPYLSPRQEVEVHTTRDLPPVIGDIRALQLVLMTLIDNALRHAPQAPIALRASLIPEGVRVEVQDQGPGLPKKIQRALNRPVHAAGEVEASSERLGLGLELCRRLLHAQDLSLQYRDLEPGASLRFVLPVSTAPVPASALDDIAVPPEPEYVPGEDTILLWSAHTWQQALLKNLLLDRRPELRVVNTAEEGWRELQRMEEQEGLPDLLLLEESFEGRGLELCAHLRARWRPSELPIVILGASEVLLDAEVYLQAGADDVLAHPLTPDKVSRLLQRLLELSRLRRGKVQASTLRTTLPPQQDRRVAVSWLLQEAVRVWTETLQRDRLELLQESRLWKLHYEADRKRWRARVFERYLQVSTLPQNPRWRTVLQTVEFVLAACEERPHAAEDAQQLRKQADQLRALWEGD
jgi:signal transduction histidine kinase/DNA-binding response OmpR family regulator